MSPNLSVKYVSNLQSRVLYTRKLEVMHTAFKYTFCYVLGRSALSIEYINLITNTDYFADFPFDPLPPNG